MKNIKNKIIAFVLACVLVLPAITVYSAEGDGEKFYVYHEDFERATSADQIGYTYTGSGTATIVDTAGMEGVQNIREDDKKALHLSYSGPLGSTEQRKRASIKFDKPITKGEVTVEIRAMIGNCSAQQFGVLSSAGRHMALIITECPTGLIRNNSVGHLDARAETNRWYDYKWVINLDNRNFDFYVDGERKAIMSDFYFSDADEVGMIQLNLLGCDNQNADLYVSDIKVSTNAQENEEEITTELEEKHKIPVGLLKALGILTDADTADMNKTITRAEFAKLAVKMAGVDEGALTSDSYADSIFSDVPNTHPLKRYIMYLKNNGIISGCGDSTFCPENEISTPEGQKILLNLLGYEAYAEVKGGYTVGYEYIAKKADIKKNVDNNGALTYGDAIIMIYNALHVDLFDIVSITNESQTYGLTPGISLLTKIYECEKTTGVMNASQYSGLSYQKSGKSWSIEVNRKKYKTDSSEYDKYLGYNVICYSKTETDEVVFVYPYKNETKTIEADSIVNVSASDDYVTVSFEKENGKESEISVNNLTNGIYNGLSLGRTLTPDDLDIKSGTLTFLDNDSTGGYDVVIITEYKSLVIDAVDLNERCIYGKNGELIELNDNYLITKNGKAVGLEELSEWDSVAVLQGLSDGESPVYTEVLVTTKTVTGIVKSIGTDYYMIGDVKYRLSPYYFELDGPITASEDLTVVLDIDGKILAKDDSKSIKKEQIGYLLAMGSDGVIEPKIKFRMLCSNGEIKVFEGASKILVNDVRKKEISEIETILKQTGKDQTSVKQPIKFYVNSDEEIIRLDSEYFKAFTTMTSRYHRRQLRGFQESATYELFYSNATKIFVVPDEDEENITVISGAELPADAQYACQGYNRNDYGVAEVIVLESPARKTITTSSSQMIINEIETVINDDGDTVCRIYGFYNKNYVSYLTKTLEMGSGLGRGDVVRISLDGNVIINMNRDFILSKNPAFGTSDGFTSYCFTVYGSAVCFEDGYIALKTDLTSETIYPFEMRTGTRVYLYDRSAHNSEVVEINAKDLSLYTYDKRPDAKVYLRANYGEPVNILVILS